ncbi:MAG TPA: putative glycolipid-binding domain-containing protein [Leptolyngbyaceae cyanobacterium M33_DOE_097]|nr:putative glycolipid-binding domain-containing protein [Leptolyngbyaceae cyanobacterium M33_DOE_097]
MNSLEHTILWHRLDCPGHDSCCLRKFNQGWQLSGTAIFLFDQKPCLLSYEVNTNSEWETCTASVSGYVGKSIVALTIARTPNNHWSLNNTAVSAAADCIDLDLGFTPATNLVAIRRLSLAIGARSSAPAAWLEFPDFTLKQLEQHYHRIAHDRYEYAAPSVGYADILEVDDYGAIACYPQLWEQER